MSGSVGLDFGADGDLVWTVERDTPIVVNPHVEGDVDSADFDFFCRHADGDWEPVDLPPVGKVLIVPAGATLRAVPKDPEFKYPEPAPGSLHITMVPR